MPVDKRVIDLTTTEQVADNDFIEVDRATLGSRKYRAKDIGVTTDFVPATDEADGAHGLVPAPVLGMTNYVLGNQGWIEVENTPTENSKKPISSGAVKNVADNIPTQLSQLNDDSTHRVVTDTEKSTWNNKSDFSGSYNDLTDKPTIPDELADLSDDSTHRLVTDAEKTEWNEKSNVEANPSGTASAELKTIGIDNEIYKIVGGEPVYGSSSGDIATFDDGGNDKPLKSLKVAINPVQDLHGYDSPWIGGGGKNICPDKHYQRDERTYVIGTDTNNTYPFSLVSGQAYTFSLKTSATTTIQIYIKEENQASASNYGLTNGVVTFTPSTTGNYIIVLKTALQDTPFSAFSEIMLEKGSTKTSYAPYSNICPISGWDEVNVTRCGKNKITSITEGIELNSTTGTTKDNTNWYVTDYVRVEYGKTFYLSGTSSSTVCYYDKNKTFTRHTLSSRIITPQEGEYYVRCNSLISGYSEPQIEEGTEATAFSSFGTIYIIQLGDTYYGGKLDVTNGVMTVDRVSIALNDSGWVYSSPHFQHAISGAVGYNGNNICSCYKKSSVNNVSTGQDDLSFVVRSDFIAVRDNSFNTDVNAFKNAMTGQILVYELATPLTVQLTPTQVKTLLKDNNLWADSGKIVDVVYVKDLNTYLKSLDDRITALENA